MKCNLERLANKVPGSGDTGPSGKATLLNLRRKASTRSLRASVDMLTLENVHVRTAHIAISTCEIYYIVKTELYRSQQQCIKVAAIKASSSLLREELSLVGLTMDIPSNKVLAE